MFAAGGNYMFAETFDLGAPFTCRLSAAIDAYARGYRNAMSTWMSLSTMDTLSSGTPDNWGIELQIRTTVQNPALALWSDWTTFQSGFAQFRAAQFRIELLGLDPMVTPAIRALSVTIDMPDRIVSDQDVAVGTDGLFVNFVPNFKSLRGVSTGDQDMNTGDTKVIDIKNEAGFFIKFFDHTGAPVARTFDYNAVGYGEVSDLGILPDIPPGYSFLGQNYSGPGDTDFQYILYFGALISIPPGIAS
jgi:hypothetical protein